MALAEVFKLFGTIGVNTGEAEAALDRTAAKGKKAEKSLSFGQRVNQSFQKAERGSKVLLGATTALGAAATAAFGAFVIKGGITRALNIEDAQAKLRGLGHDTTSVTTIMNNALASVRGTAFGLDAAATTAANAVASGIKPGKQLEQVLKTVANSAAVAGTDMGSMGAIFNKVAASNKLQMDVINQLHDAGVPALALVAKEIGKTAEETAKMASAGEIDFATFERAMRKGVGEAALEMGNTTRGSWDNMKAAFSRLGAAIVEDTIPKVRDAFQGITKWIDDNSEQIVEAVKNIVDGFSDIVKKVTEFIPMEQLIYAVGGAILVGLLPAVVSLTASFWAMVAPLLPFLAIGAALGLLFKTLKDNGIDPLAVAVDALKAVWDFLKPSLEALWETIQNELLPALQELWETISPILIPALKFIAQVIGVVVVAALWIIINVLQVVISWFSQLVEWITNVIQWFQDLAAGIAEVWEGIKTSLGTALEWIKTTWENVWNGIKDFFTGLWEGILAFLTVVVGIPLAIINTVLLQPLMAIWEFVWGHISSFFTDIWNGIVEFLTPIIENVKETITKGIEIVKTVWNNIWNGIKTTFTNVWNGIKNFLTPIIDGIKTTITNVFNGIKNTVTTVWDNIRKAIEKPINKAKEIVENVINAIKGFFDFKIKWPKIPLPHFGIKPKGWQIGDLLKGKLPSLDIEWRAKGAIFRRPTIFGSNDGRLQGAGEAGPEAALPLNRDTLGMIGDGIAQTMAPGENTAILEALLAETRRLREDQKELTVLLDSGELVGAIHKKIDKALESSATLRRRGVTI